MGRDKKLREKKVESSPLEGVRKKNCIKEAAQWSKQTENKKIIENHCSCKDKGSDQVNSEFQIERHLDNPLKS